MQDHVPPPRHLFPAPSRDVMIVDDDATVCESLALILSIEGYRATAFTDGESFLDAFDERVRDGRPPVCVLIDAMLPGRSGLDILRALSARHHAMPVFMMSGHADIATAVAAIRGGAADFIEKPFAASVMLGRVREAAQARCWPGLHGLGGYPGGELLTRRERDVLEQIAGGASNKEAARRLGISPRTVEVHRARIMDKVGARNAADLVRIVLSERQRPALSAAG
ncbi:MAG: response regulator transcription factor [Xanthobacteraceae bacterium]|nr:MAG: response regulator transcription factor [Xanthobacteraceae bacterium]